MRLINIHTLQLEEFSSTPPEYAILSHRWTDDEISYKDFVKGRNKQSAGYAKVKQFCDWVKRSPERDGRPRHRGWFYPDDVEWVWVDTCCIDKRSSAELSEAISSMWKWYEDAAYCAAYLADFDPWGFKPYAYVELLRRGFLNWFSRGWTLQELLAPRDVVFCTRNWERSDIEQIRSWRTQLQEEQTFRRFTYKGMVWSRTQSREGKCDRRE